MCSLRYTVHPEHNRRERRLPQGRGFHIPAIKTDPKKTLLTRSSAFSIPGNRIKTGLIQRPSC
jgi:hypothetical protein